MIDIDPTTMYIWYKIGNAAAGILAMSLIALIILLVLYSTAEKQDVFLKQSKPFYVTIVILLLISMIVAITAPDKDELNNCIKQHKQQNTQ